LADRLTECVNLVVRRTVHNERSEVRRQGRLDGIGESGELDLLRLRGGSSLGGGGSSLGGGGSSLGGGGSSLGGSKLLELDLGDAAVRVLFQGIILGLVELVASQGLRGVLVRWVR
jgi:hypothetical protein